MKSVICLRHIKFHQSLSSFTLKQNEINPSYFDAYMKLMQNGEYNIPMICKSCVPLPYFLCINTLNAHFALTVLSANKFKDRTKRLTFILQHLIKPVLSVYLQMYSSVNILTSFSFQLFISCGENIQDEIIFLYSTQILRI